RPARRQVSKPLGPQRGSDKPAGTYNIWYGKYEGERTNSRTLEKATSRCVPSRDSGKTKASPHAPFCLPFARGCCNKGPDCQFLHRIPTAADAEQNERDCFGRERFRDEREDMDGVGSFEKENKTLYVGRIQSPQNMDAVVRKHFAEWGELQSVRTMEPRCVSFVSYRRRSNAEFAKEAMAGQALDHGEILNVRWATEDPNP
ncbi:hypothetical protein BDK51DRAFT_5407, partial [Blyttiomyces helicus]